MAGGSDAELVERLSEHVSALLPLLLKGQQDTEGVSAFMHDDDTVQALTEFAQGASAVLYFGLLGAYTPPWRQRNASPCTLVSTLRSTGDAGAGLQSLPYVVHVNEAVFNGLPLAALMRLTQGGLAPDAAVAGQVLLAPMPVQQPPTSTAPGPSASQAEAAPLLQAYLRGFFTPLLRAAAGGSGTSASDPAPSADASGLRAVAGRLADLDTALQACRAGGSVPTVDLTLPPALEEAAGDATSAGGSVDLAGTPLAEAVEDSAVVASIVQAANAWIQGLNTLQSLVAPPPLSTLADVTWSRSHTPIMPGPLPTEPRRALPLALRLKKVAEEAGRVAEAMQAPAFPLAVSFLQAAKQLMPSKTLAGALGSTLPLLRDAAATLIAVTDLPMANVAQAGSVEEVEALVAPSLAVLTAASPPPPTMPLLLHLVRSAGVDLASALSGLCGRSSFMARPLPEFRAHAAVCTRALRGWVQGEARLIGAFGTAARSARTPLHEDCMHTSAAPTALLQRLDSLVKFREAHEALLSVVAQAFSVGRRGGDTPASLAQLEAAYTLATSGDMFAVDEAGIEAWRARQSTYSASAAAVEVDVTARLQERLSQCNSTAAMLQVLEAFQSLLQRPRVRSAVAGHQRKLLAAIGQQLTALQRMFAGGWRAAGGADVAAQHNVPPTVATVMWLQQLRRGAASVRRSVQLVLGESWEDDAAGRTLVAQAAAFIARLDPVPVVAAWTDTMQGVTAASTASTLWEVSAGALRVAFAPALVELLRESNQLRTMGFRIPSSLREPALFAEQVYPLALELHVGVSQWATTRAAASPDVQALVQHEELALRKQVQSGAAKGLHWDEAGAKQYVQSFSAAAVRFADAAAVATAAAQAVEEGVAKLASADASVAAVVGGIQDEVTRLSTGGFANVPRWAEAVHLRVAAALQSRVASTLQEWTQALRGESPAAAGAPLALRLDVQEGRVVLDPPLHAVRGALLERLAQTLHPFTNLPIVAPPSATGTSHGKHAATYASCLFTLPVSRALDGAAQAVEGVLADVAGAMDQWTVYESLWSLTPDDLQQVAGQSLPAWHELLAGITAQQRSLQEARGSLRFGGSITLDLSHITFNLKQSYAGWVGEAVKRFAAAVKDVSVGLLATMQETRETLEVANLSGSSRAIVQCITATSAAQAAASQWSKTIDDLRIAERSLQRHNFTFPSAWVRLSQVEGEWGAVSQILAKRAREVDEHLPSLKSTLLTTETDLAAKAAALNAEWAANAPTAGGGGDTTAALTALTAFATRAEALAGQWTEMERAREAIGSAGGGQCPLGPVQQEAAGLTKVWMWARDIEGGLNDLASTPWPAVVPQRVRAALTALSDSVTQAPPALQQYAVHTYYADEVARRKAAHPQLVSLKSPALQLHHWASILTVLGLAEEGADVDSALLGELTLGQIWEADPAAHAGALAPIFTRAAGEENLAKFMRDLKTTWGGTGLTSAAFSGGRSSSVVTNFNEVLEVVDDHLGFLTSMKASPYFDTFKDDATSWSSRLSALRMTLDLWVAAQKAWVHLAGLFSGGSGSIKVQLPSEWGRFRGADSELQGLVRKHSVPATGTASPPSALELVQAGKLDDTLGRLVDTFGEVQRALGKFLERQRGMFARFYFLGDEDLLEVLGAQEPAKAVQRHVARMFAGIAAVDMAGPSGVQVCLGSDGAAPLTLSAMLSRDGETIPLTSAETSYATPPPSGTPAPVTFLRALQDSMRCSLREQLAGAVDTCHAFDQAAPSADAELARGMVSWWSSLASQVTTAALYIAWTAGMGAAVGEEADMRAMQDRVLRVLSAVAVHGQDAVEGNPLALQHTITTLVHLRDCGRRLLAAENAGPRSFPWLRTMRHVWDGDAYTVQLADASFDYGYEYLGIGDRLVVTDLTERCYLTLTQALRAGMGGNPFGPAGTGKTESVKALGGALGRHVLVFNCDEAFDVGAMGRILTGLCQTGAWGCFDEFNRLTEGILSAVSGQVQAIQEAVLSGQRSVRLLGRTVDLHPSVGIFVTMNPGYAGRSELPDNLKALFRPCAMMTPDWHAIAEVLLFAQGFREAETLASHAVTLFRLCREQLTPQVHYDFGLRALKQVLVAGGQALRAASPDGPRPEPEVLLRSIVDSTLPKLVPEDIDVFTALCGTVFQDSRLAEGDAAAIDAAVQDFARVNGAVASDAWTAKVRQLASVVALRHGVMLVGPSGTGKTAALHAAACAVGRVHGSPVQLITLDPKAQDKDALYGSLDQATLEWTDGIFTAVLRAEISRADDARGAGGAPLSPVWIVFDGDVDPEWAENLNSVLDDNRLLTLPSGERLPLPHHVRMLFETDTLAHATPATVSRCGMVWFHEAVVPPQHTLRRLAHLLSTSGPAAAGAMRRWQHPPSRTSDEPAAPAPSDSPSSVGAAAFGKALADCLDSAACGPLEAMQWVASMPDAQVMSFPLGSPLSNFAAVLCGGLRAWLARVERTPDITPTSAEAEVDASAWVALAAAWAGVSAESSGKRGSLLETLVSLHAASLPPGLPAQEGSLLGWVPADGAAYLRGVVLGAPTVDDNGCEWVNWADQVPPTALTGEQAAGGDTVVQTVDTLRNSFLIRTWLDAAAPLVLCGPPGSGKTMTLTAALDSNPNLAAATMAFSSGTTAASVLQSLEAHCVYTPTPAGVVLAPPSENTTLTVFADEVNLPTPDAFGTQSAIAFMRCAVEHGGFWVPPRKLPGVPGSGARPLWIALQRVTFVGACNPPTDAGRSQLSSRFMRHAPLLYVGFPSPPAMRHIFTTMITPLLSPHPALVPHAAAIAAAMVHLYAANASKFSTDEWAHYVYSPRELSRWVRALGDVLQSGGECDLPTFTGLWAHEALRIFADRLVRAEDVAWCQDATREALAEHLPEALAAGDAASPSLEDILTGSAVYTTLVSGKYESTSLSEFRAFVAHRARDFAEEVQQVQLITFDDVLRHLARIDRVLGQQSGHLLLVGQSGAGKTLLTRFAAWSRGIATATLKVHRGYGQEHFDADLRSLLTRAGVQGEPLVFIFDEGNVLDTGFLERMNALLASGEVPGLFEADDWTALMSGLREAASAAPASAGAPSRGQGEEALYAWFVARVRRNLHVAMTMNPATADFTDRAATSPALFNRCIVDWFGDWSAPALTQTAATLLRALDLAPAAEAAGAGAFVLAGGHGIEDIAGLALPAVQAALGAGEEVGPAVSQGVSLVSAAVQLHRVAAEAAEAEALTAETRTFITPRHFLDFLGHVVRLWNRERESLAKQHARVAGGLAKLRNTSEAVAGMKAQLHEKEAALHAKQQEAETKLGEMLEKQQVAETQRTESEDLAQQVAAREGAVAERKAVVEDKLKGMQPLLEKVKAGVSSIKRSALDEIRALARPPEPIRKTMEALLALLESATSDGASGTTAAAASDEAPQPKKWTDIKRSLQKRDFIPNILNFNTETVTPAVRQYIADTFLSDPDFTQERAAKSSKACGPLFEWVTSQVQYAEVLQTVAPLREEVGQLEDQATELAQRAEATAARLAELQDTIAQYKREYAKLIAEGQELGTALEAVQSKVSRAEGLVAGLAGEEQRWASSEAHFAAQTAHVPGAALLHGAFAAYAGFFGFQVRASLHAEWSEVLDAAGVPFDAECEAGSGLAEPADVLAWRAAGAAEDDLATQNSALLSAFARFPLIIDPTGEVQQVVCEKVGRAAGTAPVVVSYLDPAFPKRLESSLRFGNTLVVTDAEGIDPLLNPVLGREYSSLGGRSTVTVGASEVDVSPAFQMFMFTSDATHQFAPDILSRVTAVNNSVTPGSLRSVALARILTAQRPDIAKQRGEALKLAAEYTAQLRQLEDDVLTQLSSSTASLLEDDATLKAMERLKQETAVVENKAADVASALEQLTAVTSGYEPLVAAAVEVYFALRKLPALHAMYRWSLHFFLSALDRTLAAAPSADTPDTVTNTVWALARTVLGAVRPCMFRAHAAGLTAGVLLACSEALGCSPPSQEVALVQGRVPATEATLPEDVAKVLPPAARASLAALTALPHEPWPRLAESLTQNTDDWVQHFSEGRAQPAWQEEDEGDAVRHAAWVPLVLQAAAAPAGLWAAVARWESALLGDDAADCAMTLEDAVRGSDRVVLRSAPVFIAGAAGVDVVQRAQEAAAGFTSALHTVPMGDPDSFDAARAAVDRAMSGGDWVLLSNVHLATAWLPKLLKQLQHRGGAGGTAGAAGQSGKRGKVHAKFRIILCAEVGEEGTRIPAALLRVSTKVTLQRPAGMRAAVLGALHCIPRGLWSKAPVESTRVLFALAWLHASVSERCRYAPLGWTKRYTFSDGDLAAAAVSVGRWVDLQYGQGAVPGHVEPDSLPWEALRKLVGGAHHGGRLSTDVDAAVLLHLAEAVLTPSIFDADHNLSLGPGEQLAPPPPAANSLDAFEAWARRLPAINPPAWLGLPAGCEQATLSREGSDIAAAFSVIAAGQVAASSTAAVSTEAGGTFDGHAAAASTYTRLEQGAQSVLSVLEAAEEASGDAVHAEPVTRTLLRWLAGEASALRHVAQSALADVQALQAHATLLASAAAEGRTPPPLPHTLRTTRDALAQQRTPSMWLQLRPGYTNGARQADVTSWLGALADASQAVCTLTKASLDDPTSIISQTQVPDTGVALAALHSPAAALAALQQAAAAALQCPVHQIKAYWAPSLVEDVPEHSGIVQLTGLFMEGACPATDARVDIAWTGAVRSALPATTLLLSAAPGHELQRAIAPAAEGAAWEQVPVFASPRRSTPVGQFHVLSAADFPLGVAGAAVLTGDAEH